jgi:histidinol-phosphate aminotransferase
MENLIRENIKNLESYSSARDEYNDNADIFLDANENPFNNGVNRYPDPYYNKLKLEISGLKGIVKENIILGNGSDEILDLIFRTFCEPKQDNIIICPPTYGMYKVMADINNVEIIKVLLNDDFSLNSNKLIDSITENTKLIILCSPNNPTGSSIQKNDLKLILDRTNSIVVVDEAYIDFSNKESAKNLLSSYPNLIVIQTLSKAWGMAALRLGMAFASKTIIDVLYKVKPPYNVNTLSQKMAISNLKNKKLYKSQLNSINKQKQLLIQELTKMRKVVQVFESDANFILVKFSKSKLVFNHLKNNGIIIRDRSNQELCEDCLRISIGKENENKKLVKTLKELEI